MTSSSGGGRVLAVLALCVFAIGASNRKTTVPIELRSSDSKTAQSSKYAYFLSPYPANLPRRKRPTLVTANGLQDRSLLRKSREAALRMTQETTRSNRETIPNAGSADEFASKTPVILIWEGRDYPRTTWKLPRTQLCGGGCEITTDKRRFDESDAVMFYEKKLDIWNQLRFNRMVGKRRKANQVFVWWCHESPWTVKNLDHKGLEWHKNFFNLTMHYRRDSDLVGAFIPHSARDWYLHRVGRAAEASLPVLHPQTSEEEFNIMFERLYQMKNETAAAWIVSDCHFVKGADKRFAFGRAVAEHFPVNMMGKCAEKELPRRNKVMFDTLQSYKFYFAFENTENCRDYITEKFWYNSLYAATIPVAWGTDRSYYDELAPPGSFIHAQDFNNDPKELALYLQKVSSDKEEYKNFFRWWYKMPGFYPIYNFREPPAADDVIQDDVMEFEVGGFCHLCQKLQDPVEREKRSTITSLKDHFFGGEDPTCYLK